MKKIIIVTLMLLSIIIMTSMVLAETTPVYQFNAENCQMVNSTGGSVVGCGDAINITCDVSLVYGDYSVAEVKFVVNGDVYDASLISGNYSEGVWGVNVISDSDYAGLSINFEKVVMVDSSGYTCQSTEGSRVTTTQDGLCYLEFSSQTSLINNCVCEYEIEEGTVSTDNTQTITRTPNEGCDKTTPYDIVVKADYCDPQWVADQSACVPTFTNSSNLFAGTTTKIYRSANPSCCALTGDDTWFNHGSGSDCTPPLDNGLEMDCNVDQWSKYQGDIFSGGVENKIVDYNIDSPIIKSLSSETNYQPLVYDFNLDGSQEILVFEDDFARLYSLEGVLLSSYDFSGYSVNGQPVIQGMDDYNYDWSNYSYDLDLIVSSQGSPLVVVPVSSGGNSKFITLNLVGSVLTDVAESSLITGSLSGVLCINDFCYASASDGLDNIGYKYEAITGSLSEEEINKEYSTVVSDWSLIDNVDSTVFNPVAFYSSGTGSDDKDPLIAWFMTENNLLDQQLTGRVLVTDRNLNPLRAFSGLSYLDNGAQLNFEVQGLTSDGINLYYSVKETGYVDGVEESLYLSLHKVPLYTYEGVQTTRSESSVLVWSGLRTSDTEGISNPIVDSDGNVKVELSVVSAGYQDSSVSDPLLEKSTSASLSSIGVSSYTHIDYINYDESTNMLFVKDSDNNNIRIYNFDDISSVGSVGSKTNWVVRTDLNKIFYSTTASTPSFPSLRQADYSSGALQTTVLKTMGINDYYMYPMGYIGNYLLWHAFSYGGYSNLYASSIDDFSNTYTVSLDHPAYNYAVLDTFYLNDDVLYLKSDYESGDYDYFLSNVSSGDALVTKLDISNAISYLDDTYVTKSGRFIQVTSWNPFVKITSSASCENFIPIYYNSRNRIEGIVLKTQTANGARWGYCDFSVLSSPTVVVDGGVVLSGGLDHTDGGDYFWKTPKVGYIRSGSQSKPDELKVVVYGHYVSILDPYYFNIYDVDTSVALSNNINANELLTYNSDLSFLRQKTTNRQGVSSLTGFGNNYLTTKNIYSSDEIVSHSFGGIGQKVLPVDLTSDGLMDFVTYGADGVVLTISSAEVGLSIPGSFGLAALSCSVNDGKALVKPLVSVSSLDDLKYVNYNINWGDGSKYTSQLLSESSSGEYYHDYQSTGDYTITVQAVNNYDVDFEDKTCEVSVVVDGKMCGFDGGEFNYQVPISNYGWNENIIPNNQILDLNSLDVASYDLVDCDYSVITIDIKSNIEENGEVSLSFSSGSLVLTNENNKLLINGLQVSTLTDDQQEFQIVVDSNNGELYVYLDGTIVYSEEESFGILEKITLKGVQIVDYVRLVVSGNVADLVAVNPLDLEGDYSYLYDCGDKDVFGYPSVALYCDSMNRNCDYSDLKEINKAFKDCAKETYNYCVNVAYYDKEKIPKSGDSTIQAGVVCSSILGASSLVDGVVDPSFRGIWGIITGSLLTFFIIFLIFVISLPIIMRRKNK